MKNSVRIVLVLLFTVKGILESQTVTGKLVDENGATLSGVRLQLYASPDVYTDTSGSDGTFTFNNITGVKEEQLPPGYSISDNFPNPFNPRTRIGIKLPTQENVKVEIFNLLGQRVVDVIKQSVDAGTNYIDVELNGLPNGLYISRITIGDKYTVVKKLMLIYGSQHLITDRGSKNTALNKSKSTNVNTNLDSLVATSSIIGRKTFTGLPSFDGGTLNLGSLVIERYCNGTPTVSYLGKTYNTVQIGSQCWLRENLDVGTMIQGIDTAKNNGIIEKYCYDNDTNNCNTYGALYQWDEAMQYSTTHGARGVCPTGWHIPTYTEYQTLSTTVGGDGNALKEIGQGTDWGAGTNTSGFSALLAGGRDYNGVFSYLGNFTNFWSSTESSTIDAELMYLYGDDREFIYIDYAYKEYVCSVRCVKD
jgi:uncharacterized protein (TIGR02145 family)